MGLCDPVNIYSYVRTCVWTRVYINKIYYVDGKLCVIIHIIINMFL